MKKILLTASLAVATVMAAAPLAQAQTVCPTAPTPITVSGRITANTTWTSNNIYLLQGFVFVESGVTLTIQPGTIIKGDLTSKGTLTIKQGGKIDARGTASNPIVFTSNQPAGQRARGDWGGLIILGKATQNIPASATAPLPSIEGGLPVADGTFGGTDDADNSGFLQYVRIEFPGIAFSTDNEINGLTLGGVGSGTTID
ncbi:MAG: T9SS C-terminal target domain-containing protein, partial [Hymenobacter sp.]